VERRLARESRKTPLDFDGNLDHVILGSGNGFGLQLGEVVPYCALEALLAGVCLIVTVLRHLWPWQRYVSTECHSSFFLFVYSRIIII